MIKFTSHLFDLRVVLCFSISQLLHFSLTPFFVISFYLVSHTFTIFLIYFLSILCL